MLTICALLTDPNPNSALRPQIANLYKKDINAYNKTAKEWTQQYAM